MSAKILVIGSSNTDMVVKTKEFPQPGQTVLGGSFLMNPGGKGANQAVAAARLGADLRFVAKIGKDIFGQQALEGFVREGLDVGFISKSDDLASGIALITVNESGENQIVVASGANMDLKPESLPDEIFKEVDVVLVQLEIPMDTVGYVIKRCAALNIRLVLNPAPATRIEDELLRHVFLITPNETETEILTGILPKDRASLQAAAQYLRHKGVENVVITMGKNGVYLCNESYDQIIPSVPVNAVDTTAAGDVFNGALVTAMAAGEDLRTACQYACKAAAISVTRMGAQSSAPYQNEIE